MKYWSNEGKYEAEAAELNKLVPVIGHCDTFKGETWRAATKIYHDYFNNGFGNFWQAPAAFLIETFDFPEKVKSVLYMHANGNYADGMNFNEEMDLMIDIVIEQLRGAKDRINTLDMWEYKGSHRVISKFAEEYSEDDYFDY